MRCVLGVGVVAMAMLLAGCAGGRSVATRPVSTSTASPATSGSAPSTVSASAAKASPSAPAVTSTPAATAIVESTPLPRFTLTSTAFEPRTDIPPRYTCDGADVSPALAWSGAPAGTESLVLIVHDPDAGFLHWLAYGIAGAPSGTLPEAIPASAGSPVQGRNGFGKIGYGGPCPPPGSTAHHYVFGLWAVSRTLDLGAGKTAAEVEAAMGGDILGTTELVGLYKRH